MTVLTMRVLARWSDDHGHWCEVVRTGPTYAYRSWDAYHVLTAAEALRLVAVHTH